MRPLTCQSPVMPGRTLLYSEVCESVMNQFRLCDGPRSHETHVALDDVDQLGKLVDARLAEETADRRHTGVERQFLLFRPFELGVRMIREVLIQAFFRTDDHRAEFEAAEGLAIPANAPMAKENRAAIDRHKRRDCDKEGCASEEGASTALQDRRPFGASAKCERRSGRENLKPIALGDPASSIPDSGASGNSGSLITNSETKRIFWPALMFNQ